MLYYTLVLLKWNIYYIFCILFSITQYLMRRSFKRCREKLKNFNTQFPYTCTYLMLPRFLNTWRSSTGGNVKFQYSLENKYNNVATSYFLARQDKCKTRKISIRNVRQKKHTKKCWTRNFFSKFFLTDPSFRFTP